MSGQSRTATLNDTIDASDFFDSLRIDGGAGNDIILGGAGNDFLDGGVGDDWISGRDGIDTLLGGTGRDVLVGGAKADKINTIDGTTSVNTDDDDILIGGTTKHDIDTTAIAAIMAEWAATGAGHTFLDRVTKIKTDGVAGSFKLTAKLSEASVFDDGAVDQLFGGTGEDLVLREEDRRNRRRNHCQREWAKGGSVDAALLDPRS